MCEETVGSQCIGVKAGSEERLPSCVPDRGSSSLPLRCEGKSVSLPMLERLVSVYTTIPYVLRCVLFCASKWEING